MEEPNYVLLGKNIKKYRQLAEMTQEQLAEAAGCSDRHIGQIETGKNIPSLAKTVKIANALNVSVDRLLYGDWENRVDYFIKELVSLTDGFESENKLIAIKMVKAIVSVMKDYGMK